MLCYTSIFVVVLHIFVVVVDGFIFNDENPNNSEQEGYYWREFTGPVPRDALPAGTDIHGRITYVGQVLYKEQLIPARIDLSERRVLFETAYTEIAAATNVKILCAKHPEQFEWIKTGNQRLNELADRHLVKGGHEEGAKIYIGRKQIGGALVIGKIISTKLQTTLNTTNAGKGYQHSEFEILTYNPSIKPIKKVTTPSNPIRSTQAPPKCNSRMVTVNFFI